MALRKNTTTTTPDVEESRAELELLEGQKKASQNEMLDVAADKKRVEEERADTIAGLDAEILTKQNASKDAEITHQKILANHADERAEAVRATEIARAEQKAAEQDRDVVRREVNGLAAVKEQHTASIIGSTKRKSDLEFSITSLGSEEQSLTARVVSIRKQTGIESALLTSTVADHQLARGTFEAEKKAHAELSATKAEKVRDNTKLDELATLKRAEAAQLTTDIADLQKKKTEQETEISERDAKSNQRLSNATALELKIDAKLAQLKEIESHFAVGELARVGYKRIGT